MIFPFVNIVSVENYFKAVWIICSGPLSHSESLLEFRITPYIFRGVLPLNIHLF